MSSPRKWVTAALNMTELVGEKALMLASTIALHDADIVDRIMDWLRTGTSIVVEDFLDQIAIDNLAPAQRALMRNVHAEMDYRGHAESIVTVFRYQKNASLNTDALIACIEIMFKEIFKHATEIAPGLIQGVFFDE